MKKHSAYIKVLLSALVVSCSNQLNAPSDISDPVFPRTPSIMPLANGNEWTFSTTWYDSLGKKIYPNRLDFHIAINTQYGLQDDSTLVLLDWNNAGTQFKSYAYQYEMEERGMGYLLVYRDRYPLETRGLYIIGEYDGAATRLYSREQLWLAYPADSGKMWQFETDPFNDSNRTSTMEVLSNHARFYMLNETSMTGVAFSDSCYLYKETMGDTVSYYYYDKKIGNLGYLQYANGVLRKTLVLKTFGNTSYGYRSD